MGPSVPILLIAANATHDQCSREWPCNHCQARKVPHLCQFAPRKVTTPEDDSFATPAKYDNILLYSSVIFTARRPLSDLSRP